MVNICIFARRVSPFRSRAATDAYFIEIKLFRSVSVTFHNFFLVQSANKIFLACELETVKNCVESV